MSRPAWARDQMGSPTSKPAGKTSCHLAIDWRIRFVDVRLEMTDAARTTAAIVIGPSVAPQRGGAFQSRC